jgi:diguanylate cyclase (GGDEF)-like protein
VNASTIQSDSREEILASSLEIGKLLTSTLNLNDILQLIMEKITHLVQADNWSLLLKEEDSDHLRFKVAVGIDLKQVEHVNIPLGEGIAGRVAESGKPLFVNQAESDSRIFRDVDKLTGFTTKSLVCIPLKIHGNILGVIEIINVEDMKKFKKEKLPVLSILADYAAIAIENSRYLSRIKKMSITDEYTGLYNARYLHEILPGLMHQADQKGTSVAVGFIDIDDFKRVVDSYGHLAGSKVLKEIGQTISESLGKDDLLIKYGGDEYILLLPGRGKDAALKISKTILKKIRNTSYLLDEDVSVKLTASIGLAIYPDDAPTSKDLLLRADDSMYKVKKSTKNDIGLFREIQN